MDLTTELVRNPAYRVLVVSGDIDLCTGPALRTAIMRELDTGQLPLLIDMSDVPFCDSSGLSVAVVAKRHAAEQGVPIAIFGLTPRVHQVFRMTSLDQYIPTYGSLSATLDALSLPS